MFGIFTVGSKSLFLTTFVFLLTALSVTGSREYNQWPTYEHSENSEQLCYECPPGYYLGQECELGAGNPGQSKCIKCSGGDFQGWSNRPRCWAKEKCGPGERLHVDGKDIAQDVCECSPNYMRKTIGGLCHEAVAKTEYSRIVNEKKICPACPACSTCPACPVRPACPVCPACPAIEPVAPCTTVEPKPCNVSIPCPPAAEQGSQESYDETGWKVVAVIGLGILTISIASNIFLIRLLKRKGNTREIEEPQNENDPKDNRDTPAPPEKTNAAVEQPRDNGHPYQPLDQTPYSQPTGDETQPVTRPGHRTPPRLNIAQASNKGVDEECTPGPKSFVPDNREGKEVDTISEDGNLLDKATPFEDEVKEVAEDGNLLDKATPFDDEVKEVAEDGNLLEVKEVGMVSEEGDQHGKASLYPGSGRVSYKNERKKIPKHRTEPKNSADKVSCNKTKEQKKRDEQFDKAVGILEDTVSADAMHTMRQVLKLPVEEAMKIDSEESDGVKKIQRACLRWREKEGERATVELLISRLRERDINNVADRIERELNILVPGEKKKARDQLDEDFATCERSLSRQQALHFAQSTLKLEERRINKAGRNPQTFVTNILYAWKEKEGDSATSELFRQLLRKGGHIDIADEVALSNAGTVQNYIEVNESEPLIQNNT